MDSMLETGRCSLRKCIQGGLDPSMARVEVNSFVVKADEWEHMEVGITLKLFSVCVHSLCCNGSIIFLSGLSRLLSGFHPSLLLTYPTGFL